MDSRADLEMTIRFVLRGIGGHPSRRSKPLMDEGRAARVTDELLEALARAGYTITDRDGRVVVQGRPPGEPHSISM